MDKKTWDRFFGDPANRKFPSGVSANAKIPGPSRADPRQSAHGHAYAEHRRLEAERTAFLKARTEETRRKFEELRIRNYVDHYFNMAMLNAKLSKLLFSEKRATAGASKKERSDSSENYIFYRTEKDSLTFRTLKKATKNEPFRIEVDVRGFNPKYIRIDSTENRITIKATTIGGVVKSSGIICRTLEDVDKITIHVPKGGVLLIEGPKPGD